ncbi:MAG TPA: flippase [Bryobacteraceae bacterium]|nr:flippase [Bryobacteraceae bacterium]
MSAPRARTSARPDPFAQQTQSVAAPAPKKLATNLLFLIVGEFTAKLLTFASFSYLARTLGPRDYGFVEFTLALMVFFTLPVDLGLGSYGAREIARNPDRAPQLLHEITGLRLFLSVCSMAALGSLILFVHQSHELKQLLMLYGLSLLGAPFLLQWLFQGHDQMRWVALTSIVRQLGFAGLVFLAFRRGTPLLYIGLIECASVAGAALFCAYVTRLELRFAWPWPDLKVSRLMGHLKQSSPIGLTELAWGFMWYFCTVLLGLIFSDATLGWWGASHRALMALHTFVWLYFFNLLPSISRCALRSKQHLLELMDESVRFTAWMGLLAGGLLMAVAPDLLALLYGPNFRQAARSFSVLVWMLPVAMLSGHHRYILIAYKQQGRLLVCTSLSAASAVILGLILVPRYDGPGAAWALLIANTINLALVYFSVKQLVVEVPVLPQLATPLAALAAAAALFFALFRISYWLALTAALTVYVACFLWIYGRRLALIFRSAGRGTALAQIAAGD